MPSCLLDAGYVMHVNMTQNLRITGNAKMEYSVDQPAALGCQIRYFLSLIHLHFLYYCNPSLLFPFLDFFMYFSFWYCLYDPSSPLRLSLELKMVRDKYKKSLLKISEHNIIAWKKAKAFLGNQPGGYRVSQ